MAGFPVPPEARLEALLREAFEFMPGPDMARLADIESRLLRAAHRPARPRRAPPPWWAILLLAGGAASAAWWAAETILTAQDVEPDRQPIEFSVPAAGPYAESPRQPAPGQPDKADMSPAEERTQIIYERETP